MSVPADPATRPRPKRERPGTPDRRLVLGSVACGSLLAPLDSAVNVAFPALAADFGLALRDIQWLIIAFVLTQASLVVFFGRVGDRHGHRRVFLVGVWACVVSHALCALAPSYAWLIAARALQGAAIAMTLSCAPALATLAVGPEHKRQVLGLYVMILGLGFALGPVVGGLLVDTGGWAAVFWLRVPIALLALVLMAAAGRSAGGGHTHSAAPLPAAGGLDAVGALLLATTASGFVLALALLGVAGESGRVSLVLLAAAVASAVALVRHARRTPHPILDPRHFAQPALGLLQFASIVVQGTSFVILMLLPFRLTAGIGRGLDLGYRDAGLLLALFPLGTMVGAILAGRAAAWLPSRRAMTVGLSGVGLGLAASAWALSGPSSAGLAAAFALTGLALGLFQVAYLDETTGLLPLADRGVAGSLFGLTRSLGLVVGAALIGWLHARLVSADPAIDADVVVISVLAACQCGVALAVPAALRRQRC